MTVRINNCTKHPGTPCFDDEVVARRAYKCIQCDKDRHAITHPKTNPISNPARRSGINPITGLFESYIGMMNGDRLVYKRSIAGLLGLEEDDSGDAIQCPLTKPRRSSAGRTKRVFTRHGTPRDPTGEKQEKKVREFWEPQLERFEDFTADGSYAIGADYRGYSPVYQKTVYIEAQGQLHELTNNEYAAVVRAEEEGALYVIHARNRWDFVTTEKFKEVGAWRLMYGFSGRA